MTKSKDISAGHACSPAISPVCVRETRVMIPTYAPEPPDRNPMYLEKRVYQGSSGEVYPLPFYSRISPDKTDREWHAVILENEYIELMILPEIGGRIHAAKDKINGYDFIYRQHVIKPALVGLAGPWISGGIEFNWPQHHRPATFMPVDYHIERDTDGSVTVWLSDHDPMQRMKGMHGVCLQPGKSCITLNVRVYNRTERVQTFLWWANVATRVHEQYQSFFPTDVHHVADHAKRAMSRFPLCDAHYYGVDYADRAANGVPEKDIPRQFIPLHCRINKPDEPVYAPNDLSWYANIPVPTSYMCMGSEDDFFGGYDHMQQAGLVHVANHHIAPGKKQWTWGNHDFGYAWDRNLTDEDGPYIELMAGVYTDNQPDFSFLMPGETKTWSQYWYPIRDIGVPQQANHRAAVRLSVADQKATIGMMVTEALEHVEIRLTADSESLFLQHVDIIPEQPLLLVVDVPGDVAGKDFRLQVELADGECLSVFTGAECASSQLPAPATEPPLPSAIESTDELYFTGLHLDQYRHATRLPSDYWQEALRRDPGDARCNNAMGVLALKRGALDDAIRFFKTAIGRATHRNPNPLDGEPFYNLGVVLRLAGRGKDAYDAFYKATWNMAWQAPAYLALAEMDCQQRQWARALAHLTASLRYNTENLRALNLKVMVLRQLQRIREADDLLDVVQKLDPIDCWSRWLCDGRVAFDSGICIDLALDLRRAGFFDEALAVLLGAPVEPFSGTEPMRFYCAAWIEHARHREDQAKDFLLRASACEPDFCFPSRIEEMLALEFALTRNENDHRAHFYLGNLLYGKRRHTEAIRHWQASVALDATNAVAWRNIGIGVYNTTRNRELALTAFMRACEASPEEGRLLYECDQLWKRVGKSPQERLAHLEASLDVVSSRDDLALEYCALLNQVGRSEEAAAILASRHFQPWEGGEGVALGQHVRTHLLLGQQALAAENPAEACRSFKLALTSPANLGEARHLLANQSDVNYWLGCAHAQLDQNEDAAAAWQSAAEFKGDFQNMEVRAFSEMTYFSALALQCLERYHEADVLLNQLDAYAKELQTKVAKIDYFATSLPTLLIFEADIQFTQETTALFLQAQAKVGLGEIKAGLALIEQVLDRDPNHALAQDLKFVHSAPFAKRGAGGSCSV